MCDEDTSAIVIDNGSGMCRETVNQIFTPFFTTKGRDKGTGLGLFISYNLVNEIGGTIKLESEDGKGATVTIRIPVKPEKHLIAADEDRMDMTI